MKKNVKIILLIIIFLIINIDKVNAESPYQTLLLDESVCQYFGYYINGTPTSKDNIIPFTCWPYDEDGRDIIDINQNLDGSYMLDNLNNRYNFNNTSTAGSSFIFSQGLNRVFSVKIPSLSVYKDSIIKSSFINSNWMNGVVHFYNAIVPFKITLVSNRNIDSMFDSLANNSGFVQNAIFDAYNRNMVYDESGTHYTFVYELYFRFYVDWGYIPQSDGFLNMEFFNYRILSIDPTREVKFRLYNELVPDAYIQLGNLMFLDYNYYNYLLQNTSNVHNANMQLTTLEELRQNYEQFYDTFSTTAIDSAISKIDDVFEDIPDLYNSHGLLGIVSLPLRLVRGLVNNDSVQLELSFKGKNFTIPNGSVYWNRIPQVKEYLNIFYLGLVSFYVLKSYFKIIENMRDPEADDRVDVMNL